MKSVQATPQHKKNSIANPANHEYYGTLAKEVYSAAKRQNWTPERTKHMLSNPRDFERYLSTAQKRVSFVKFH